MGLSRMMIENFFKATYLIHPDFDYASKAYLEMQDFFDDDLLSVGTDKHTDKPIAIRWSDEHNQWVEVPISQVTGAKWRSSKQYWEAT